MEKIGKFFLNIGMIGLFHFSFTQVISSQRYGFEYGSIYTEEETAKINHFINEEVECIDFVQLLPCCKEGKMLNDSGKYRKRKICYFESILFDYDSDESYRPNKVRLSQTENQTKISASDYAAIFQALYSQNGSNLSSLCYEPRHGICFYGKNDELLGFVEICFTCSMTLSTNGIPNNKSLGQSEFEALKSLFNKYGFKTKDRY